MIDIEALVERHYDPFAVRKYEYKRAIRNALNELAAGYEERLSLLKRELKCIAEQLNDPRENLTHSTAQCIASLQERIRQLEAERAPDGWRIERDDDAIIVTKLGIGGCVVNRVPTAAREIPEPILWELADSMLAAAPQPKKEGE